MMEIPPQSAVIVRWTFMACVVLVFAGLGAMAILSPHHGWTGIVLGWAWLQEHS